MTLKAILASLDDVPEELRSHYAEQEDGKFLLAVEPVGGFALEDVAGLKRVSDDRKKRQAKLQEELDGLKEKLGDLDLDAAREALERPDKKLDEGAIKEKIEAATKRLQEQHQREREAVEGKAKKYREQAERLLIDSQVAQLLTKDGLKGSFDLLQGPVRSRVKIEEGDDGTLKLSISDPDGQPMYAPKGNSVEPAGLEDLLKSMREDPKYQRAFDGTGASGGGATGAGRSTSGTNQVQNMSLSPTERLANAWATNGAGQ